MENLSLDIVKSLSFLNVALHTSNDIYRLSFKAIKDLCSMDENKDGYEGQIRKKSSDFRTDLDNLFNSIKTDNEIFQSNMTAIISNKKSMDVVYSINKFSNYLVNYKKQLKEYKKLIDLIDLKIDIYRKKKDYVKVIALISVSNPTKCMNDVIIKTIDRLETLLK